MSRLKQVDDLLRESCDMAPFPWRYTERMQSRRIECANGNIIVEFSDHPGETMFFQGTREDLDRLARGISELCDAYLVLKAAVELAGAGNLTDAINKMTDLVRMVRAWDALEFACRDCKMRPCRCRS